MCNLQLPQNPKEVQPHYYEEKFADLMAIVLGEKK